MQPHEGASILDQHDRVVEILNALGDLKVCDTHVADWVGVQGQAPETAEFLPKKMRVIGPERVGYFLVR